MKTTAPYQGQWVTPDAVAARLEQLEAEHMAMKVYEVIRTTTVSQQSRPTEDQVSLIRASSVLGAAKSFCNKHKIKLGPQWMEYEPGPRGQRAQFRAMKDWKMFGGVEQYNISVKEADID